MQYFGNCQLFYRGNDFVFPHCIEYLKYSISKGLVLADWIFHVTLYTMALPWKILLFSLIIWEHWILNEKRQRLRKIALEIRLCRNAFRGTFYFALILLNINPFGANFCIFIRSLCNTIAFSLCACHSLKMRLKVAW